ncbi:hypothetical protein GDO78_000394 [Eleutherodactylus coqui]|uniref:Uncharacterized protein n=1 Tax=Eleutherodactylus coqui TaxID=57060 RepID=A0A8J6KHK1_ELECQ|nr:hypothetical protein GDO78_000394 [Eleutherodactylus coqui]
MMRSRLQRLNLQSYSIISDSIYKLKGYLRVIYLFILGDVPHLLQIFYCIDIKINPLPYLFYRISRGLQDLVDGKLYPSRVLDFTPQSISTQMAAPSLFSMVLLAGEKSH